MCVAQKGILEEQRTVRRLGAACASKGFECGLWSVSDRNEAEVDVV